MNADMESVLISQEQIAQKVDEFARLLSDAYADKDPVFVGVLKGVVMFFADVVRKITVPCQIDFMWISSYQGTESKVMEVVRDIPEENVRGRHVVILEDIFDTGNSLQFTYDHLMHMEPASLKICTLLDKPERRNKAVTVKPDYVGFTIPDKFVVGYGLDYKEQYRNLPYVGILKPEIYNNKES